MQYPYLQFNVFSAYECRPYEVVNCYHPVEHTYDSISINLYPHCFTSLITISPSTPTQFLPLTRRVPVSLGTQYLPLSPRFLYPSLR